MTPPGAALRSVDRWLLAGLTALLLALWSTRIAGVFSVDEPNYLATLVALREGLPHVPGSAGLGGSVELASYDPVPWGPADPPRLTAPPLYAPLALGWAALGGLDGLLLLNLLGFAWSAALVYGLARRLWPAPHVAPWLAVAYALGSFNLEYAVGLWPHMLAVALCTTAFALGLRAMERQALGPALAAGLCVGLAMGLRYQEVIYAGALCAALAIWGGRRRFEAAVALLVGCALPLLASTALNLWRLGLLNPLTKGNNYLKPALLAQARDGATALSPLLDPFHLTYARLVDFAAHPEGNFGAMQLERDAASGAYVVAGAVKKALLQSIPWALPALLVGGLVLWRTLRPAPGRTPVVETQAQARALGSAALIGAAHFAVFAVMGFNRYDGMGFNQRYLLELVPLCCLCLGPVVQRLPPSRGAALAGAAVAALALGFTFGLASPAAEQRALMWLPLALSAALLGSWLGGLRAAAAAVPPDTGPPAPSPAYARARRAVSGTLAAALLWSLGVHLGDDLQASRSVRRRMREASAQMDRALPRDGALALFAVGYWAHAAAPLLLERELLIIDALRDELKDAPSLLSRVLASGRRVFIWAPGFSAAELARLAQGRPVRRREVDGRSLFEVLAR